jgi:hypothetical protein
MLHIENPKKSKNRLPLLGRILLSRTYAGQRRMLPHEISIKGIVSRDFGTLFLISLDRFEDRNRARAGLFFILMTFLCLNLKKLCLCGIDPSE